MVRVFFRLVSNEGEEWFFAALSRLFLKGISGKFVFRTAGTSVRKDETLVSIGQCLAL